MPWGKNDQNWSKGVMRATSDTLYKVSISPSAQLRSLGATALAKEWQPSHEHPHVLTKRKQKRRPITIARLLTQGQNTISPLSTRRSC